MIELALAALIQIATITTDISSTPSADGGAEATTTTSTVDGGTGTWDDNQ
jgi:hypothetical protein